MGLVLLIVFFSSIWVYFDARSIGVKKGVLRGLFDLGPAGWFWVCLLLWIVGFPAYLAKRGELKRVAAVATSASISPSSPPANDALEQLAKLGELRKSGVLTEEEFTAKKKQLLDAS